MAAKVSYKQGTKQTYLNLETRLSNALYFCTDTKELFKGDDLYSDGLRIVKSYAALPEFASAADGILYFCADSGSGYVLNEERNAWLQVIHGVDNETIGISAEGFMQIKAVPIAAVSGLEARLAAVENAAVGGIHYCGAVDDISGLPADASQGDLYEVRSDNSEWCFNGETWFEYGKTTNIDLTPYATKEEVESVARLVAYEISSKPEGALVNYSDEEIRVMCPADTKWVKQQSGEGSDANTYYIGFKAYAPSEDVVSFKEDLTEIISDSTMYYFDGNDFAGTDEYGRKYSIVWLPVAVYDETSQSWTYYGARSSAEKYVGWHYSVEWYNAGGVKVAADTIRINLSNEDCHTNAVPFYVAEMKAALEALDEANTWGDI